METKDIVKQAKVLNWIEIIVTAVMYVAYRMLYTMAKNAATVDEIDSLIGIENAIRLVAGIFSIVVIILTAVLLSKNQKRVQGLGLLLASGIVTLVFSILGVTLNIVMWCLCGASLSRLKKSGADVQFQNPNFQNGNFQNYQNQNFANQNFQNPNMPNQGFQNMNQ
ncbi:hypothetical protein [Agathobacter sp.]